jgi:hypothetical protein
LQVGRHREGTGADQIVIFSLGVVSCTGDVLAQMEARQAWVDEYGNTSLQG